MKVAILSDSHDHIANLEKVVKKIKKDCQAVIFCGDLIAPFSAKILAQTGLPTYLCLGNNDEDHIQMQKMGGDKFVWTGLSDEYGQVELGGLSAQAGKKIAFCHYPKLAELLATSGEFDAVFHGHTHVAYQKTIGRTLLLNPGAICGIQKGKIGIASYATYDTTTNSAKIVEFKSKLSLLVGKFFG